MHVHVVRNTLYVVRNTLYVVRRMSYVVCRMSCVVRNYVGVAYHLTIVQCTMYNVHRTIVHRTSYIVQCTYNAQCTFTCACACACACACKRTSTANVQWRNVMASRRPGTARSTAMTLHSIHYITGTARSTARPPRRTGRTTSRRALRPRTSRR